MYDCDRVFTLLACAVGGYLWYRYTVRFFSR